MENRKSACDGVEQMFYNPTKARDTLSTLITDRRKSIEKVLPFLRKSPVFDDTDKDKLRSLSQMVASKEDAERALGAKSICRKRWEGVFDHVILKKANGTKPTRSRITVFSAQNTSGKSAERAHEDECSPKGVEGHVHPRAAISLCRHDHAGQRRQHER